MIVEPELFVVVGDGCNIANPCCPIHDESPIFDTVTNKKGHDHIPIAKHKMASKHQTCTNHRHCQNLDGNMNADVGGVMCV